MENASDKVWDDMVSTISERQKLGSSTFDLRHSISRAIRNDVEKNKNDGIEVSSGTVVVENETKTEFGREFIDNHVVVDYYFSNDGKTVMYGGSHPHLVLYRANSLAYGFAIDPEKTEPVQVIQSFYTNVFCDFQGTLPSEYADEPIAEKCKNVLEIMHGRELHPKLYNLAKSKGYERGSLYGFNSTKQIVELSVYDDVVALREYIDDYTDGADNPLVKYVTDVYWDFLYNISRINNESVWYYCVNFRSIQVPCEGVITGANFTSNISIN